MYIKRLISEKGLLTNLVVAVEVVLVVALDAGVGVPPAPAPTLPTRIQSPHHTRVIS